jgi:outer membrane lipoprotein
MRRVPCSLIFLVLISVSCAPIISEELGREISRDIAFKQVIKDPEVYIGKTVLISGIIIGSENTKEGTLIEILQKQADREGRPKDVDDSDGRFLALYDGYLDTAIYTQGREVAVAGEIRGKKVLPLGQIDYTYPLISIKEIHLFKVQKEKRYYIYPYPYPYPYRWWDYPYLYP